MSINFPLILVLATAFTGVVWLVDYLVFRPEESLAASPLAGDIDEESRKAILQELGSLLNTQSRFFLCLLLFWYYGRFCSNPFRFPRVDDSDPCGG